MILSSAFLGVFEIALRIMWVIWYLKGNVWLLESRKKDGYRCQVGLIKAESLKKLISSSTLGAKNILYESGETNERVECQRRDFNIPRAWMRIKLSIQVLRLEMTGEKCECLIMLKYGSWLLSIHLENIMFWYHSTKKRLFILHIEIKAIFLENRTNKPINQTSNLVTHRHSMSQNQAIKMKMSIFWASKTEKAYILKSDFIKISGKLVEQHRFVK